MTELDLAQLGHGQGGERVGTKRGRWSRSSRSRSGMRSANLAAVEEAQAPERARSWQARRRRWRRIGTALREREESAGQLTSRSGSATTDCGAPAPAK